MHWLVQYENILFAVLAGVFLSVVFAAGTRRMTVVPGKIQNLMELIVETLQDFFTGILGRYGKTFVPFLGTLFLYVFCMNMMGLVPFLKSSTTDLNLTLALAFCVFVTVQYTAVTKLGAKNYIDHLACQPRSPGMYLLAVFMLPLFLLLDVIMPPITLSLRLFGNITGEDTLLGAFLDMSARNLFEGSGIGSIIGGGMSFLTTVILRFLSVLLGTIQALVFALLSTIYILMVLPHEEHAH
ncbi:F0F1 ATP synthase subunit A [bacterium]|nr:F0F1 ATP synthase subunit A [bacterium]